MRNKFQTYSRQVQNMFKKAPETVKKESRTIQRSSQRNQDMQFQKDSRYINDKIKRNKRNQKSQKAKTIDVLDFFGLRDDLEAPGGFEERVPRNV